MATSRKELNFRAKQWEDFLCALTPERSQRAEAFSVEFQEPEDSGTSLIYKKISRIMSTEYTLIKPCNKWSLTDFSKCIGFRDLGKLNTGTKEVTLEYSLESIINENLQMFQIGSERPNVDDVLTKEVDVRTFIDSILRKLCTNLDFGVRLENKPDSGDLPGCKFDYLVFNHSGKPIGCVEAKSPSEMKGKAFVQAVLELFVLQKFASKNGVDVTKVPLFNILTDGLRFVLLQVKGDKILLEQNEDNKLKVHRVKEHLLQEQNEESHTDGVMESLYRLIQTSVDATVEIPQTRNINSGNLMELST